MKMGSKLEDALWDADAAFKRLKPEQGPLGRRNARKAMLKALLKARKALDKEFPLEHKTRKRRRKKGLLNGYSHIKRSDMYKLFDVGVRHTQFKHLPRPSDVRAAQRNGEDKRSLVKIFWAPNWMTHAINADIDIRTIAKAVRSQLSRKRIDTLIRLGRTGK